jgi:hypothetical protein
MNSKIIHIIHPVDDSTNFLEEIYLYLQEKTDAEINIHRLANKEDHASFYDIIPKIPSDEIILFFGHGTSFGLSGARTKEYEEIEFITYKQLKVFEEKYVILLTCRSNQYLKTHFEECALSLAIGFPNLITDFEEVEYHDDPERVEDIKQEDIDIFRNMIVEIMKYSLEDYIVNNLTTQQLYNRIKLRINKRVINLYIKIPNKGKLPLGKMLNDMVEGISIHQKF